MAHIAEAPHIGSRFLARLSEAVTAFFAARAKAAEFSRTYAELQGLSDRELNDIGIRRCDIADRTRRHVYFD